MVRNTSFQMEELVLLLLEVLLRVKVVFRITLFQSLLFCWLCWSCMCGVIDRILQGISKLIPHGIDSEAKLIPHRS